MSLSAQRNHTAGKKRLALILMIFALVLMLVGCSADKAKNTAVQNADGSLTIPLSAFDDSVHFIDLSSNGTAMQLMTHKGIDGQPRLSWNTCQVCNGSPLAYFEFQGDQLICKNCGNTFSKDTIGGSNQGCYPWAVSNYAVNQDSVTIPADAVKEMAPYFTRWKKGL